MNLTVTTQAHDVVTAFLALDTVGEDEANFNPLPTWAGFKPFQKKALALKARYQAILKDIPNVFTKASRLASELNQLLTDHDLEAMFDRDFSDRELGAVAVIDNRCQWPEEYEITSIQAANQQSYHGFIATHCRAFKSTNWPDQPLIALFTQQGQVMWCFMAKEERSGFEMTEMFLEVFNGDLEPTYDFTDVYVPMVDFNLKPDISAWEGTLTVDKKNIPWVIKKAMQQYILKINHRGFEQIIASGIGLEMLSVSIPYHIDRPFYVCTTPTQDWKKWLPVGAALVGFDSWKAPQGTFDS